MQLKLKYAAANPSEGLKIFNKKVGDKLTRAMEKCTKCICTKECMSTQILL